MSDVTLRRAKHQPGVWILWSPPRTWCGISPLQFLAGTLGTVLAGMALGTVLAVLVP